MACDNYSNGSVFDVAVQGKWNNVSQTINTYQMLLISGGVTDIDTVSASLEEYFRVAYTIVKAICNAVQVFEGIKIAELDGDCATGLVPFDGGSLVGDLVNDPIPSGVAALISFPTGVKRVVLRKYIPGLDESVIGPSGNVGTASQNVVASFGDHLRSQLTYGGLTWRMAWRSPKLPSQNLLPIGQKVSAIPAYQRRRRAGTGN